MNCWCSRCDLVGNILLLQICSNQPKPKVNRLLRPDHVKRRPNKLSRRTTTKLSWRCKNIFSIGDLLFADGEWMIPIYFRNGGGMPHLIVICHRQIRDGFLLFSLHHWLGLAGLPFIPISLYHVICEFSCSTSRTRVGVAQIKKFPSPYSLGGCRLM